MPLGLATAAIAGILLWLGPGKEESPPAPEPPAQAAERLPERPDEIRPATEPEARAVPAQPAVPAGAEATASANVEAEVPAPSADAPAANSAAPAETASPTPVGDSPKGSAESAEAAARAELPAPSSGEPIPSDEGLTEGPITTIYMAPDCAELYRKGKRVGRSGVRVRIPEGKKRVYEVVCPGHGTRKLTLDGSRKELMIGLRPK